MKRTGEWPVFGLLLHIAPAHSPVCPSTSDSDCSVGVDEFDELDHRDEGQFWATKDEPDQRDDSPAYQLYESDGERPAPAPVVSLFAIGKLCR